MSPVTSRMYYTYVLLSEKTGNFYTGCTNDLRTRFKQHQKGEVRSTKSRGPFQLVYYEASTNKDDAYARERYLKSGMGKRYIKNRIKRALDVTG